MTKTITIDIDALFSDADAGGVFVHFMEIEVNPFIAMRKFEAWANKRQLLAA